MSQNELLTKINELNQMILDGRALEGLDKYYDESVTMQENDAPATIGKAANRQREIDFFNAITEFRSAQVVSVAASADKTYVEWYMDYTHKDWGVKKYNQVSVQTWRNEKIVNEKFYYGGN